MMIHRDRAFFKNKFIMKKRIAKKRTPYFKVASMLKDAGAMHEHARLKNMYPIWIKYYQHGDIQMLQSITHGSYTLIKRALTGRGGSLRVLSLIEDFYNQRIDALKRAAMLLKMEKTDHGKSQS